MTYAAALFLGLVQGLAEFLPISSSGHLVIMQHFFGVEEPMLFFNVMLHLGTLAAIFVYFRGDLAVMLGALFGKAADMEGGTGGDDGLWSGGRAQAWRYVAWVMLGTVPIVVAGLGIWASTRVACGTRASQSSGCGTGQSVKGSARESPGWSRAQALLHLQCSARSTGPACTGLRSTYRQTVQ